MNTRPDIPARIKRLIETTQAQVECYTKLQPLATLASKLADESNLNLSVSVAGTDSIDIDLTLTKEQAIDIIKPLLRAIASTRNFEPAAESDHPQNHVMTWRFKSKPNKLYGSIQVYVLFGASTICTVEKTPTGELTPVYTYKTVCK